jgi:hypothetical protein
VLAAETSRACGAEDSAKFSGRTPAMSSPLSATRRAFSAGISMSPKGSLRVVPSTVAGMKFIGGEPMKPATKRLAGLS